MKKFNILLLITLLILIVSSCENSETNSDNTDVDTGNIPSYPTDGIKNLAPKLEPNSIQLYALQRSPYMMQQVLEPLLQPFWHTREVYNETFMFVGKFRLKERIYFLCTKSSSI
jgi:hypothetical protein